MNETQQKNSWTRTLIAGALACAVVVGGAGAAQAAPAAETTPPPKTEAPATPDPASIEQALELIDAIPTEVLERGDDATRAWLTERAGAANPGGAQMRANVIGCAGAIAVALAGVAFPAAKLLKVKALIAELGGLQKAVKLMWGASFSWEKMQAAGGALAALGAELLGITGIKTQCFD